MSILTDHYSENQEGLDNFGNLVVGAKIILKWMSKKWDLRMYIACRLLSCVSGIR
jgi:hypothetical protein